MGLLIFLNCVAGVGILYLFWLYKREQEEFAKELQEIASLRKRLNLSPRDSSFSRSRTCSEIPLRRVEADSSVDLLAEVVHQINLHNLVLPSYDNSTADVFTPDTSPCDSSATGGETSCGGDSSCGGCGSD